MRYRIFRNDTFVETKFTSAREWLEVMQEIGTDSSLVAEDVIYVDDHYYIVKVDPIFGVKLDSAHFDEEKRKALYRQAYAADRAAAGVSK